MCIIIVKPQGAALPPVSILDRCARRNPDGFGYAAPGGVYKTLDYTRFLRRLDAAARSGGPLVIHFRYATHGSVRRANCHPFRDGAAGVSFAHNGVLPVIPRGDKTDSETAFRRLLSPVIRLHGLGSPDLAAAVDEIIGGSRFAFLSDDAQILTFGQFCGFGGCLYSNPNFL
jgi:hypothetical protein